MTNRDFVIMYGLVIGAWSTIVLGSAKGWNITNSKWDFTNTAQLGDSFGVISSLMASVAAYFAYVTYKSAKEESRIAERRAAEPSFLNLLERRFDVMDRIRCSTLQQTSGKIGYVNSEGQIAIDVIASRLLRVFVKLNADESPKEKYVKSSSDGVSGLTTYHRFVFHIIAFAERQFSNIDPDEEMLKSDPAYGYVRLLRAQFSDNEMMLMALNALYGSGYPKLKHFIERYALLNNMNQQDVEVFNFGVLFKPTAFGLLREDRPDFLT